jgi:hypothetical protein
MIIFSASAGSSTITVTDINHGAETGDFVTYTQAISLGGNITANVLNQDYEITKVDSSTYTIQARSTDKAQIVPVLANSSDVGNGGLLTNGYYAIPSGYSSTTYGYGWGAGTWGAAPWGLAAATPVALIQRDWWFDNFDNDLVMNIRKGAIYYWSRGSITSPDTALATRAVLLSALPGAADVPERAMQILVSQNDKHLLALGCQPYAGLPGDYDPLLIRWASQDEPQLWTPLITNSAGFLRVSRGSEIVRGLATRQEILVFTNSSLYSLQYTGTLDVFALQELADNISIISPRAVTTANNVTYWMGQDKFYVYSGQVQTLPCTIRQYVFQDLNFDQVNQIVCGTNEGFTEIWWFYPSANSNWNDRYVIFNHLEGVWYYGNLVRTAWLDTALRSNPVAAYTGQNDTVGYEYQHEVGVNDGDAPMTSYIQSSDYDLGDGEQFMLTRRLLPDFNFTNSTAATPTVTLTMRPKRFSGSAYANTASDSQDVASTYATLDQYTEQVFVRARGRQMAFRISSDGLGVQWQSGSHRLDVRPDGKR